MSIAFDPCRRYFRLDRRDLAYLTFIVEAYEGLATLSTVEKKETVVSLTSLPCSATDLDRLIEALRGEIAMTETAPPSPGLWPPSPKGRE